jgi:CheY-like chemotaxis protein
MLNTPVYLLVDDDEDDHELFTIALEEADPAIRCISAFNGQQALEMLGEGAVLPDFIFLDLNMPLMGGKECLAHLKADPRFSGIPVVIFSTSSDQQDRAETAALGAVDFITKPAKISELTELLNNFIAFHQEEHKNPGT